MATKMVEQVKGMQIQFHLPKVEEMVKALKGVGLIQEGNVWNGLYETYAKRIKDFDVRETNIQNEMIEDRLSKILNPAIDSFVNRMQGKTKEEIDPVLKEFAIFVLGEAPSIEGNGKLATKDHLVEQMVIIWLETKAEFLAQMKVPHNDTVASAYLDGNFNQMVRAIAPEELAERTIALRNRSIIMRESHDEILRR